MPLDHWVRRRRGDSAAKPLPPSRMRPPTHCLGHPSHPGGHRPFAERSAIASSEAVAAISENRVPKLHRSTVILGGRDPPPCVRGQHARRRNARRRVLASDQRTRCAATHLHQMPLKQVARQRLPPRDLQRDPWTTGAPANCQSAVGVGTRARVDRTSRSSTLRAGSAARDHGCVQQSAVVSNQENGGDSVLVSRHKAR